MPAVDSLLRLIASQNADALSLSSNQVPRLHRGGAATPLSMPPVADALMATFVSEVLSPEQVAEATRGGEVVVEYDAFTATVKRQGEGWSLAFKRGATRPRAVTQRASGGATRRPWREAQPNDLEPAPQRASDATKVIAAPPVAPTPAPAPTPVPAGRLDDWLARAVADRASDLIVSSGRPARLRTDGAVEPIPGGPLDDAELLNALAPAMSDQHRTALERHGSCDLAWAWPGGARFRVNLFRQSDGLAAAFRPIRSDPPTLAELELDESLARLVEFPNGLVLVTGPTGSGKSTTLVALVEQLNRTVRKHIITIEDPIEYQHTSRQALIHQRELGAHLPSFDEGLRAALRESPDVILVGEMRDRATIAAAITAAETGHLVISTLHAAGAAMAVERVVDAFPEHQQRQVRSQLAQTLRAVLTQHLLPSLRGGARLPAVELLLSNAATAALIRDGKTHQLATAIQTGEGMIPLDRSLAQRVAARQVSLEDAAAITLDGGLQLRELLRR